MPQSREELLRKKREYERKRRVENGDALRLAAVASVARAKERLGEDGYAARHRAYCLAYVKRNPDARRASYLKYQNNNRQKTRLASLISQKKFRQRSPEICSARFAAWAEKNPDYFAKWAARQRLENPSFVITSRLRGRLYAELRKGRHARGANVYRRDTQLVLDWFEWLKARGVVDWTDDGIHIDHVLPVSSFDMMNPLDVYAVNHWTNLLPMASAENSKKHASTDSRYQDRQRELVSEYLRELFQNKRAA